VEIIVDSHDAVATFESDKYELEVSETKSEF
jgi:hypothetical protein